MTMVCCGTQAKTIAAVPAIKIKARRTLTMMRMIKRFLLMVLLLFKPIAL